MNMIFVSEIEGICNLNLEKSYGISTNFLFGPSSKSIPCLLIPFKNGKSKLYYINTSLQPINNPVMWEIEKLNERKTFLQVWQSVIINSFLKFILSDIYLYCNLKLNKQ